MAAFTVCLLFFGCNGAPHERQNIVASEEAMLGEVDNWLTDALRSIPAEYGNTYLWFINPAGARKAANATDFKGIESIRLGDTASMPWTYDHLFPIDMPGRDYAGSIYDGLGIDLFNLDAILWAGEANPRGSGMHITLIRGGFSNDIVERLKLLNYESETHGGVTWRYAWADYQHRDMLWRSSPFSMDLGRLNAIAQVGDSLLIRRWPDSMARQIEVHQGIMPSLWDKKHYRELAQAMGNEMIAGAFITPENVRSSWTDVLYTVNPHRTPAYAPESENWGVLSDYNSAIVGYSVREDVEYNTIAVHYADPDEANRNASELNLRLNTARFHLFSASGSDGEESIHHPPIATFCRAIDVNALRYAEFSVLVADCAMSISAGGSIETALLTSRGLWNNMLFFRTLHFLVPDVRRLK